MEPVSVSVSAISIDSSTQAASIPVISALEPSTAPAAIGRAGHIKAPKDAIRTSLQASTADGVFATLFTNVTGGVLLTNFLMELGAGAAEIGLLAAIPMLANLMQPLGAYISEKTNSRHYYCLGIYSIARLLWLILAIAIFVVGWGYKDTHSLIALTLGVTALSYFLGALGSAAWLSWMAVLVPRRLRGRYFGLRNSLANLTNLISIPLMGWSMSKWAGGSIQGYGILLIFGVLTGLISLWFQNFMVDVNPQEQGRSAITPDPEAIEQEDGATDPKPVSEPLSTKLASLFADNANFLMFLLYVSVWMFAVNLSAPFFNVYLLDNLQMNLGSVSIYNSLSAGANLLMLMLWGKLADRLGNRSILLSVGILVAVTPLLWLVTGANSMSVWVWLPLLHMLGGATWAAIDLCSNNLQLGVAPLHNQATYFGTAAAVAGVSSALGTMTGGFLAEFWSMGGLLGLFALSSVLRLGALLPLVFVRE